jgi:hypothetical protein
MRRTVWVRCAAPPTIQVVEFANEISEPEKLFGSFQVFFYVDSGSHAGALERAKYW